ncbi:MAG: hypothetical protein WBK91_09890 [Alphaproteobacteria bacterium]
MTPQADITAFIRETGVYFKAAAIDLARGMLNPARVSKIALNLEQEPSLAEKLAEARKPGWPRLKL